MSRLSMHNLILYCHCLLLAELPWDSLDCDHSLKYNVFLCYLHVIVSTLIHKKAITIVRVRQCSCCKCPEYLCRLSGDSGHHIYTTICVYACCGSPLDYHYFLYTNLKSRLLILSLTLNLTRIFTIISFGSTAVLLQHVCMITTHPCSCLHVTFPICFPVYKFTFTLSVKNCS